jgi:hypothetical protein
MTATPRCEGCHRRLKQPSPSGYGPKCAKKLPQSPQEGRTAPQGPGVPPSLSRRLTATHTHLPHPGQIELPLETP